MFHIVIQKIKNKLWLTVCLLLGLMLLVVVVGCQPMFQAGALNTMLNQSFEEDIRERSTYSAVVMRNVTKEYVTGNTTIAAELSTMGRYKTIWEENTPEIDILETQTIIRFPSMSANSSDGTTSHFLSLTVIPNAKEHIEVVKGETNAPVKDGDVYNCIVSQSVLDDRKLVYGCIYTFNNLEDAAGNKLQVRIAGIFKEKESEDLFWYREPNRFESETLIQEEAMEEILANYTIVKDLTIENYWMLDYKKINSANIDSLIDIADQFESSGAGFTTAMGDILTEFLRKRRSLAVTLWVLEIPMLGMALAFIYMVSSQLMQTEKSEIAMFKSRGFHRRHIVWMYFLQSLLVAGAAILLGLPLSYGLCKLAASTTDFLTFNGTAASYYHFVPMMVVYSIGAALIGILFIIAPAFFASNISIVEYMSEKNVNKKMFWEKYFLDVVFLGVSIYLLYYFQKTGDSIRENAMKGGSIDPMIFGDSILFIVAFGFVTLRLAHYLVKLVYMIGKKRWKPAIYASFLQITRNFNKLGFISVFIILTVALGIYYANGARTINRNKEERIKYEVGADAVFLEKWNKQPYRIGMEVHIKYFEPDFTRYQVLLDEHYAESIAQVQQISDTMCYSSQKKVDHTVLMGINTKQFGQTAELKDELNADTHWYTYLNELNKNSTGAVISRNLAEALNLSVGDLINVNGKNKKNVDADQVAGYQVVAIVDAWPGFTQYTYTNGEETENYLVVVNLKNVIKVLEQKPYEIWVKLADGISAEMLEEKLAGMNIQLESFACCEDEISRMKSTPDIQITNGIFTLGFLVSLVLCGIGFLIYWISSIRQRELLFGVYRAMGMSVSEINRMLLNEHMFSTLISVLAGGIVGMASTFLFSKLMALVYLPERHNLGIYIYFESMDIVKLFAALLVMIVICLVILRKIIQSINITEALKLGED